VDASPVSRMTTLIPFPSMLPSRSSPGKWPAGANGRRESQIEGAKSSGPRGFALWDTCYGLSSTPITGSNARRLPAAGWPRSAKDPSLFAQKGQFSNYGHGTCSETLSRSR
jgi:hypothetical protein